MLDLLQMRSLLIKFPTMQVNQLQGLLYEFGVSFPTGRVVGGVHFIFANAISAQ